MIKYSISTRILNFFLLPLLLTLPVFLAAQSPVYQRLHNDIQILASDSLMGRDAGTMGEKMAADYIIASMQKIGLQPKGDKPGSFLQYFTINYPVLFKSATLKIGDTEFKHIEEFGATDLSSSGSLKGTYVSIGEKLYTQSASVSSTIDLSGKIVLLDIAVKAKPTDNEAFVREVTHKIELLKQRGAIAVILHNSSKALAEDALFGSAFTSSCGIPVLYMARMPFGKIRKIKSAPCELSVVIDRTVLNPANVVGYLDNKSNRTVVIGAHYDHLGLETVSPELDRPPRVFNGADDNASGVAMMLELARWAKNNESLKYNYLFVAFSAEEKGLFGSKAYCSNALVNNNSVFYMLNLDMVGNLGGEGDTIKALGIASSSVWNDLLEKVDHPDFSIKKIAGAPPFSDHAPFLKKGIPVIFFTTGLHKRYHTPDDDTEYLNFTGMVELLTYLRNFIKSAEALPDIPARKVNGLQSARAYLQTF